MSKLSIPGWRMAAVALAVVAAGLSGYLLSQSWRGLSPAGCGPGSGCDTVLSSMWSVVLGFPVSALALLLDLIVLGLVLTAAGTRWAQRLLAVAAGLLVAAAAWFVVVQAMIIDAWCPWCLSAHAAGVALGLVLLFGVGPTSRSLAVLGVPAVALLALVQWQWPSQPTLEQYAIAGSAAKADVDRQLLLADGQVQLELADLPRFGPADASVWAAKMFDYGCPHCRLQHQALDELQEVSEQPFAIYLLPVPLNSACNATLNGPPSTRFEGSCELARLSLAVWRADPEAWQAFDAWMWEPAMPRTPGEARAEAERVVGPEVLAAVEARDAGWIDGQLQRNTGAWSAVEAPRLPVTLVPGKPPHSGAIEDVAMLRELLGIR